jgi:hypothetical protein
MNEKKMCKVCTLLENFEFITNFLRISFKLKVKFLL